MTDLVPPDRRAEPAASAPSRLVKAVALTGLLVGALDGTAAVVHFFSVGGRAPIRIFYYIASAVFGRERAYAGGWPMALCGLFFHFAIATGWAALFFVLARRMQWPVQRPVTGGTAYGVLVWLAMNLVVVPASRAATGPFSVSQVVTGLCIHIACIGLPMAWMARRHFADSH